MAEAGRIKQEQVQDRDLTVTSVISLAIWLGGCLSFLTVPYPSLPRLHGWSKRTNLLQ